jgi:penicillin-binding protein 2
VSSTVRIKDHWAEQRLFGRRIIAAIVVMVIFLAILTARLVYLQVVRYDYFAELSQGNRIRIDPVPPSRGLIYDRNGVLLALNRPAYQLEITREQTPDLDDTLRRLVELDLLDADEVEQVKRHITARRSFNSVPVRLQLTERELARFAVHRPDFPGVEVRPRLTRYYPNGGSGVHALGYVAAISEKDQERIDLANYAGTTLIGKLGIERAYEDELHGETGYQQLLVNAQGRNVERVGLQTPELQRRAPVSGNDLILSLDSRLQTIVEETLGDRRAAVVAIDPGNGDILAYASTPTFDPNGFARGLTYAEYDALQNNLDKPLFDRALRGVYPPGSTIKPLVALAALEAGVISPNESLWCRGFYQLPGSSHRYRDWKKGGHGSMNMHSAIAQSCDTYFYEVSNRLGINSMHDFLVRFGLDGQTGIDIAGERSGVIPSPEWKKTAFKRREQQVWFPGETVIAGIGQGYVLVTPLQLAHVTATIAARGKRFAPRLVIGVRNSGSGEIELLPSKELPPVEIGHPENWDVIIGGMIGVMNDARGTARRQQVGAPYTIAGKSGTAQVFSIGQQEKYDESEISERLRDHALFIAFAPAEAPKLAVAVLVENGRSGSGTAAPIARAVLDAYLLPPAVDRPETGEPSAPEEDTE